VPRTETDQTGPVDPWQQPATAEQPDRSEGPLLNERPW